MLEDILDAPHAVYVPTQLSLTSSHYSSHSHAQETLPRSGSVRRKRISDSRTAQEVFFLELESEVNKVSIFAAQLTAELRTQVSDLARRSKAEVPLDEKEETRHRLMEEAKRIGDDYLEIEKYVNMNYVAIQKILKKHDKLVPLAPCSSFYRSHISKHPWVRGEHHDIQRTLHKIFASLHREHHIADRSLLRQDDHEHTRRFWVPRKHLSEVKHALMLHLPLTEHPNTEEEDANILNYLYLDNNKLELFYNHLYGRPYSTQILLKWRGLGSPSTVEVVRKTVEESFRPEAAIKDSFPVPSDKVADFLLGRWTFAQAQRYLESYMRDQAPGKSVMERIAREYQTFKTYTEVQRVVEKHSLRPMVRIIVQESIFEGSLEENSHFLRVTIEEDMEALLEHVEDPVEEERRLHEGGWCTDAPIDQILFPYALVKLQSQGTSGECKGLLPPWLASFVRRGQMVEVSDFSRMLYGFCGLLPDRVRAVPSWIGEISPLDSISIFQNTQTYHLHVCSDDDEIQKSIYPPSIIDIIKKSPEGQQAQADQDAENEREDGYPLNDEEDEERPHERPPPLAQSQSLPRSSSQRHGTLSRDNSLVRPNALHVLARGLTNPSHPITYDMARAIMKVEPRQFFQSERVFLTWMDLCVLLGGLAVGMLGFASKAYSDPTEKPTIRISEMTAFALLIASIFLCIHGIYAFTWRSKKMVKNPLRARGYTKPGDSRFDDSSGTLLLMLVVTLSFVAIFWLNVADLIEVLQGNEDEGS